MVHLHGNIARIRFLYVAASFQRCLFSTQRQGISKERHHQSFIYSLMLLFVFFVGFTAILKVPGLVGGAMRTFIAAPVDRDL